LSNILLVLVLFKTIQILFSLGWTSVLNFWQLFSLNPQNMITVQLVSLEPLVSDPAVLPLGMQVAKASAAAGPFQTVVQTSQAAGPFQAGDKTKEADEGPLQAGGKKSTAAGPFKAQLPDSIIVYRWEWTKNILLIVYSFPSEPCLLLMNLQGCENSVPGEGAQVTATACGVDYRATTFILPHSLCWQCGGTWNYAEGLSWYILHPKAGGWKDSQPK
jgi:hypothetical protein